MPDLSRLLIQDQFYVQQDGFADRVVTSNLAFSLENSTDPFGIVVDASGTIYIVDPFQHTVLRVLQNGDTQLFAGHSGVSGNNGSDIVSGEEAYFNNPSGLSIDATGNIYVADTGNNQIRRITPDKRVSLVAGDKYGASGFRSGNAIEIESEDHALFNGPRDVAVDASGNIFIADSDNHAIRLVRYGINTVTTVAGTGIPGDSLGVGIESQLNEPWGLGIRKDGILIIADTKNYKLKRLDKNFNLLRYSGIGNYGFNLGPTEETEYLDLIFMSVNQSGFIYAIDVDEVFGSRLLRINQDGDSFLVREYPKSSGFSRVAGVAVNNSDVVYILETPYLEKLYTSSSSSSSEGYSSSSSSEGFSSSSSSPEGYSESSSSQSNSSSPQSNSSSSQSESTQSESSSSYSESSSSQSESTQSESSSSQSESSSSSEGISSSSSSLDEADCLSQLSIDIEYAEGGSDTITSTSVKYLGSNQFRYNFDFALPLAKTVDVFLVSLNRIDPILNQNFPISMTVNGDTSETNYLGVYSEPISPPGYARYTFINFNLIETFNSVVYECTNAQVKSSSSESIGNVSTSSSSTENISESSSSPSIQSESSSSSIGLSESSSSMAFSSDSSDSSESSGGVSESTSSFGFSESSSTDGLTSSSQSESSSSSDRFSSSSSSALIIDSSSSSFDVQCLNSLEITIRYDSAGSDTITSTNVVYDGDGRFTYTYDFTISPIETVNSLLINLNRTDVVENLFMPIAMEINGAPGPTGFLSEYSAFISSFFPGFAYYDIGNIDLISKFSSIQFVCTNEMVKSSSS